MAHTIRIKLEPRNSPQIQFCESGGGIAANAKGQLRGEPTLNSHNNAEPSWSPFVEQEAQLTELFS